MGILCTQSEECWVVAVISICMQGLGNTNLEAQSSNKRIGKRNKKPAQHDKNDRRRNDRCDAMRRDTVVSGWIADYSLLMWRIYCGIYLV